SITRCGSDSFGAFSTQARVYFRRARCRVPAVDPARIREGLRAVAELSGQCRARAGLRDGRTAPRFAELVRFPDARSLSRCRTGRAARVGRPAFFVQQDGRSRTPEPSERRNLESRACCFAKW